MLYIDAGWYCDLTHFSFETRHPGHRYHISPETQTSALSWSRVTPALGSGRLDRVMQHPPRTGHSTRRPVEGLRWGSERGCSKGGLRQEGADGAANGGTAVCQREEGQEGGCTRSRFPCPRQTKLCLSILPPLPWATWHGHCPQPPTHTPHAPPPVLRAASSNSLL